jgi:hypothetical protein
MQVIRHDHKCHGNGVTSLLFAPHCLNNSAAVLKRSEEWFPTMRGSRYMVNAILFAEPAESRSGRAFPASVLAIGVCKIKK